MNKYEFEEFKRKVIESFDIAEYIGKFIKLDSSNKSLCPLHKETKGSFTVYRETQSWFCYGLVVKLVGT